MALDAYDQWLGRVAQELQARGWAVRIERAFTQTPVFQVPAQALVGAWRDNVGGHVRLSVETDATRDPAAFAENVLYSVTWTREDYEKQFDDFLGGFEFVKQTNPTDVKTVVQSAEPAPTGALPRSSEPSRRPPEGGSRPMARTDVGRTNGAGAGTGQADGGAPAQTFWDKYWPVIVAIGGIIVVLKVLR
jgi:hypothetical protein